MKTSGNKTDRPGWGLFRAATVGMLGNSLKFAGNFVKSGFCDVTKLQNAWLPMVQNKRNCGKRFGILLYYLKA